MARVVFYGDHPEGVTANGYLNNKLLLDIQDRHDVIAFVYNPLAAQNIFKNDLRVKLFPIGEPSDILGMKGLMEHLTKGSFTYDVFLSNNDIWRLGEVAGWNKVLHEKSGHVWVQVFPCDADSVKMDWVNILKRVDVPIVYSRHGFDLYKPFVPKLQYMRLPVEPVYSQLSIPKKELKKVIFGSEDCFVIGVDGRNQLRKDIPRALDIFAEFGKKYPNSILYLHMEPVADRFGTNLYEYIEEKGINPDQIKFKERRFFPIEDMVKLYNSFDVLLNTSLAEGFCFPIVQAQLCRVPVVCPKNTSMTEHVIDGKGFGMELSNDKLSFPIERYGSISNEFRSRVVVESGVEHLEYIYNNSEKLKDITDKAYYYAVQYKNPNDFKHIFRDVTEQIDVRRRPKGSRKDKILYVQHETAGDVLISTGLLANLKKKHDAELDYMTDEMYVDILEGNPDISQIIPWDLELMKQYKIFYYPHKIIRQGNWGTNDLTLYDVYSQLCEVEYGNMFIAPKEPDPEILTILDGFKEGYITLTNSGASNLHRYYPKFNELCKAFPNQAFVQLGSQDNPPITAPNCVDLRGMLTFRQSAFVMYNSIFHVGIDTFTSHLAAALRKYQIVIYGSGAKRVIKPRGVTVDIIPDYLHVCPIIGPCWGSYRKCQGECIKLIPLEVVLKSTQVLMEELQNENQDSVLERIRARLS